MTERMKTEAERRLHDSIEALDAAAVRKQRVGCEGIPHYTFADGSIIEVRKLSGRCAFSATGWHLANSK